MIYKLDDYLIDDIFQKISEKHQLKTRKTNFQLAVTLFIIYFTIHTPLLLATHCMLQNKFLTTIAIVHTIFFYSYIFYIARYCKKLDKHYEDKDKITEWNPLRKNVIHLTFRYVIFLVNFFLTPLIFAGIIFNINFFNLMLAVDMTLILFGLYFAACLPIPRKRLRKMIKDKIKKLEPELAKYK